MKRCPVCTTDYTDERKTCPTDGAVLLVASDLSPGTLIRGKYRIIARLGRGGMGTVYKAEHVAFEEVRALKVMAPTDDAEFVRRFRQEAQAARRLRHPNVVHVDDLDQADDGSFFIVMDYVDGVSLRQLFQATQGPLPLMRTLGIVRSVADALAAAHALGMVHRDIKPENILLARDPQGRDIPKVLDFGIVAMKENSSTQSTRYLLTPAQGSPEQWRGMKSSELDGRADLYALGVVWYEMLTGRLPLHADTNEGWMRAHLMEIPQPPSVFYPELAPISGLDALVLKLLAKDREQRPQDAQAFLGELNIIEAQLSWNYAAVAKPPVVGDATAMLGSPSKEAVFHALSPSGPHSPLQPPFEAASIEKTAINMETSIMADPSTTSSIATLTAPSVEATPKRWLSGFAMSLIGGAIFASLFVLAAIYDYRSMNSNRPSVARVDNRLSPLNSAQVDEKACDSGNASSCWNLGNIYATMTGPGTIPKDDRLALQLYQKGCEGGDAQSCNSLAFMYDLGEGVARDLSRAIQPYQKACDGGVTSDCNYLGVLYQEGRGVAKSLSRAVQLYQKGCDGGVAQSCSNLAFMYWHGRGVPQDESRAARLYQNACDQGVAFGCNELGVQYQQGRGVAINESRAVQLYQKGCDGGVAQSCSNLGSMYRNGQGVPQDENRAVQLYRKGCDGGNAEGCANVGK
jgi:TPR repeat protein